MVLLARLKRLRFRMKKYSPVLLSMAELLRILVGREVNEGVPDKVHPRFLYTIWLKGDETG